VRVILTLFPLGFGVKNTHAPHPHRDSNGPQHGKQVVSHRNNLGIRTLAAQQLCGLPTISSCPWKGFYTYGHRYLKVRCLVVSFYPKCSLVWVYHKWTTELVHRSQSLNQSFNHSFNIYFIWVGSTSRSIQSIFHWFWIWSFHQHGRDRADDLHYRLQARTEVQTLYVEWWLSQ